MDEYEACGEVYDEINEVINEIINQDLKEELEQNLEELCRSNEHSTPSGRMLGLDAYLQECKNQLMNEEVE
jgi:hypothetical protein